MYDELVRELRERTDEVYCNGCEYRDGYGICKIIGDCAERLFLQAADAIEELQQIAEHYEQTAKDYWKEACDYKAKLPRWISVEERLPEKYGTALVTTERGSVMVCCYYPQAKNWNTRAKVKWWMPLPLPPTEET